MTEPVAPVSPRAQRFARRLRGEHEPTFEQRMREQAAARDRDENGERLSAALALLAARPALDRELNGTRLQALAAAVGDDLLDAIREADLAAIAPDGFAQVLPQAGALARRGERLLAKVGTSHEIAALAAQAAALVRSVRAPA